MKLCVEEELCEHSFIELAVLETECLKFEIVLTQEPSAEIRWEIPIVIFELSPSIILGSADHSVQLLLINGGVVVNSVESSEAKKQE